MWLEDGDVLVLAKKNKQDPTQVQFPDDGAAVCLWIYSMPYADIYIHEQLMLHHSSCDIYPNLFPTLFT